MREITLIKTAIFLLSLFFLTACNADKTTDNETTKAHDMFTKKKTETYVIVSPMEGVLMQDGEPLPNAKIIRRLTWNGNEDGLVEEFATDSQGRFSLPLHEEELSLGMLNQFVGSAFIYVNIEEDDSLIWYSPKVLPEIYSESDGPLKELVCDINVPEIVVNTSISNILTKCRWQDMPE